MEARESEEEEEQFEQQEGAFEREEDQEKADKYGNNGLHHACGRGHLEIVLLLFASCLAWVLAREVLTGQGLFLSTDLLGGMSEHDVFLSEHDRVDNDRVGSVQLLLQRGATAIPERG